jgi:hypothetical protein
MPRQKRADEAGGIYHALNRGNARQTIFHKDEDYQAFLRVLSEGLHRYHVELFAFTLMPNHWHMVLRPCEDGLMGRGRPFGSEAWMEEVAQRTGLDYTLRARGRPRKQR